MVRPSIAFQWAEMAVSTQTEMKRRYELTEGTWNDLPSIDLQLFINGRLDLTRALLYKTPESERALEMQELAILTVMSRHRDWGFDRMAREILSLLWEKIPATCRNVYYRE